MAFPFAHPRPDPQAVPRVPVIDSDWWRLCEMPDLGDLAGPDFQGVRLARLRWERAGS